MRWSNLGHVLVVHCPQMKGKFFFISYFFYVGFFFYVFLFNLFNYHIFIIRPYSQIRIQDYWVWYCSQTHLNLGDARLMLLLIL